MLLNTGKDFYIWEVEDETNQIELCIKVWSDSHNSPPHLEADVAYNLILAWSRPTG